ncbi:hypothetical protein Q4488_01710 [Amphritea sp. 1_MG-2023]|uniref:hypothetical protein n=1 Tax=Amphritea sp. 1_MG-2023 TaxID=3062670 RepID=UPI0026E43A60|nr:hypothetical protein [Amphritea sp. 1_MG-2023]MDO6562085.1 hypothetical protein [Amphritea sp. 1_MG-2023]
MVNIKTVITQTARMKICVNVILTLLVSSCALVFIPLTYEKAMVWFVGVSIATYLFVHFGMVLRSRITLDKNLKYTMSIPDYYSNANIYIPIEYIANIEVCEYKLFEKDCCYPDGVNKEYYYRKKLFGYLGAGLIVCYQLPKAMTGDSIIRGIKFP